MAAIREKEYARKNEAYWKLQKVRTLREIETWRMTIPAGTICKITRKMGGFSLNVEACPKCGVVVHVRKIPPHYVELILPAVMPGMVPLAPGSG